MPIAADYPFMDVLWSMIIFFFWVIWIWIVITVLIDVFRRHDIGGFAKALWVIFVVILPWLGVLIYLIVEHDGMRERSLKQAQAQKEEFDQHVREAGRRFRRRDRQGQGATRPGSDHPGRVQRAQGEGALVTRRATRAIQTHERSREMADRPVFLYAAVYDEIADAEADYEAVFDLHAAGAIGTFDSAVIRKEADGKVRVTKTEKPTQHGAWTGAAVGALVGISSRPRSSAARSSAPAPAA